MIIIGIESSCDETAVAVVKDKKEVLSSVVASQIDVHTEFGGVVPEVASRIHVENISYCIEKALKDVQSKISILESQRSSLSSEVNSLNDSLTDTLLNIEVLESDLADKEVEIEQAQEDYEAAKATEDKQYASMKTRIQYLYESGETSYVELLLTSEDVGDLINKVDYAEELQESDRRLLDQYKAAKADFTTHAGGDKDGGA